MKKLLILVWQMCSVEGWNRYIAIFAWNRYITIFLQIKFSLHKFSNCKTFTFLIVKNLDVDPVPDPQNRTFFNSQYNSLTTHERYAFSAQFRKLWSVFLTNAILLCALKSVSIKKSLFDGDSLKISNDRLFKWPMDYSSAWS